MVVYIYIYIINKQKQEFLDIFSLTIRIRLNMIMPFYTRYEKDERGFPFYFVWFGRFENI